MSRRALVAVAGFAIAAGATFAVVRRPERAETAAARARPLARLSPDAFDTLVVRAKGETTTIRREGETFQVTAPVRYPAHPRTAQLAFDAIARLDLISAVSDRKERHAELQVDVASGVHVIARKGERTLLDFVVGKTVDEDRTMVRPSGRDEVWQAAGELRDRFELSTTEWRDRTITAFAAAEAETVSVTASDGARIELRTVGIKEGAPKTDRVRWQVVRSSVPVPRLEDYAANQLVATMSSLNALAFADGAAAAACGLDPPLLTVVVGLKDGNQVALRIGKPAAAAGTFVARPGSGQIFVLAPAFAELVARRPVQFRDKTLCDIPDKDVVEIAVRHGADSFVVAKRGGVWTAMRPAGLDVDPDKVAPLASVFRGWTAPRIAEDPPAGVMRGAWAAVVARAKNASCTVEVGGVAEDGQSYFVRTPNAPDIYVVPKWMIERIVLPPERLKKV